MTGSEALQCVRALGFKVILKGDKPLIVPHPDGKVPPPELVATLRANRDAVVAALGNTSDTQAAVAPQGMSLEELMKRHFIPRREFVPGIIVQGVTLLASKAKIGKTWLTLNTGLALASGGRAFGKIEVEPVGVLILSLEDGPQRLQDRFALLLNDEEPPDNLHIFTDWPRLDAGGGAQLDEYLTEHRDVKVIWIDTLAKIRPARRKGGDLYAEDYAIGEVLKVIAEKHGVAIVLVYHTRKASADDPLDEIRDTMGLTGGVDNCLVLRRARGQADAELFVSGRDIAEEKGYALSWDAITTQWIIAGDASEYAVSTARKQVLDALEGAPDGMTPTEVARKLGKPLSGVKKLMWTMSKDDTLAVTEGRYQKHGNRGNRVTVNSETLAGQGKLDTDTVTSRLPNVALGNRESNRINGGEGSNSKENDEDGYPVTTVTDDEWLGNAVTTGTVADDLIADAWDTLIAWAHGDSQELPDDVRAAGKQAGIVRDPSDSLNRYAGRIFAAYHEWRGAA